MWILNPLESGGVTYYLLPSREYVVGRKNCEIILLNDQSISRAHAQLTATDQTLTLKDNSKYGTFVNEERLSGETPRSLKSGDRVTFGVFHSKFSVEHQVLVVCSSCVDSDGKASLSQVLLALGGRLVNSWTHDCTHLVMPTVKVTIKTICALLCCRPIVKQEFFTELSKAVQQKQPPPKAESFYPEIDEPSLNKEDVDLKERPERKRLFAEKTFIFLNAKQLKRLSSAVSFGGGRSQLLEEGSLPMSILESPWSCVVDVATGNSQVLLPTSTKKWADSVGRILHKKGLRFITESEIGLAAIYVNCDKYCNPSNQKADSESMQVKPFIPGATLSQNAAVDETVLPASSQNITAYVVNTEPSQGVDVSAVSVVGETPERNQSLTSTRSGQPKPTSARELTTTCTVAETMMLSFNATDGAGASERKRAETEHSGGGKGGSTVARFLTPPPQTNVSLKRAQQKYSPQKQQPSPQGSPQKQSALTSFFQPVSKKRPREGESSDLQSEPKRTVLPCTETTNTPTHTPSTAAHAQAPSQTPSATHTTVAKSQSQQGSGADLFPGQSEALSDRVSRPAQQGLQSRKRKEMEEEKPKVVMALEMEIEELESIMSQEMDESDEQILSSPDQQSQLVEQSSISRSQRLETVEHTSANKKQRVHPVEHSITNQRLSLNPEEGPSSNKNQHSEPVAKVKDEEVSFIEDSKPNGAARHLVGGLEIIPKCTTVKQEASVSEAGEDLPRRLLMVEFKSLTVTMPSRGKPQPLEMHHGNAHKNNFKRFRKIPVPGAEGLPNIIGGSDLLTHIRAKNSELEEWLREAGEEERQKKRDETLGDDLFRYNPKPIKRR